jgi:hypothetical protein
MRIKPVRTDRGIKLSRSCAAIVLHHQCHQPFDSSSTPGDIVRRSVSSGAHEHTSSRRTNVSDFSMPAVHVLSAISHELTLLIFRYLAHQCAQHTRTHYTNVECWYSVSACS